MVENLEGSDASGRWLPVAKAAAELGITEQGVRNRISRKVIVFRKDNHNRLMVFVPNEAEPAKPPLRPLNHVSEQQASQLNTSDKFVELLQANATAAERRAEAAERRIETALAAAEQRHQAETSRLMGIMTERVDAAECRAERAEKLALDALTQAADTAERITKSLIEAAGKPLWRRFFG